MITPELLPFALALLFGLSTTGVLVTMLYPRLAGRSDFDRRVRAVIGTATASGERGAAAEDGRRKRSVDAILRDMEETQKSKKRAKPSLVSRMRQADLSWTRNGYYLVCLVAGGVALVAALFGLRLGLAPSIGFAIAGGLMIPHFYVNLRRRRRFKRFAAEFPNAVDVIVRGVKAGLPLVDCLKIIATEAQDPVRSEFKTIVADQTLGMPMHEAVERLPERIPLSEANFFAIVIAIQSRTGGSLSEALGNLSRVLRERKKMQAKIKAMSSEAKASGGIIGSLPVIVGLLVYFTSPDYISLLFTEQTGNFVLAGCAVWMGIGIMVMRKMINFDF